jgi:hypothetical protein
MAGIEQHGLGVGTYDRMVPPVPRDPNEPSGTGPATDELDLVESGRRRPQTPRPHRAHPPHVTLGHHAQGGLSPAILAIVERGVRRRPAQANALTAEVELAMQEQYPPVRIVFGKDLVLVEDGPGEAPDLRIEGALPDLVSLMVAPTLGGVPSPINARGRAALTMVAGRRIRLSGKLGLMRKFLGVIRL